MGSFKELLRRMWHFGPIATLGLISTITLAVIYCSLMWWPPHESLGGLLNLTFFLFCSGLVLFHFLCAMVNGPGYLPFKWKPEDEKDEVKLQFCAVCEGFKAPRAHHCRKCGRCVMKMDHHCPWINNCVGHRNHAHFFFFLVAAVIGCSDACIILGCSIYRAIYRSYNVYYGLDVPYVYLGIYGLLWGIFSLGCAIGVTLGVGFLLFYQMKIVFRNKTSIEEWIMEKAEYRRKIFPQVSPIVYPYNFGWKQNAKFVLNLKCSPAGDGITWPVLPGCTQHTLTCEQLQQKWDKKKRSREYATVEDFSGSWCPITKGFRVALTPPISDEPRIALDKNDRIVATRWKKHWLYGHKVDEDGEAIKGENIKGWFPRRCVIEILNSSHPDCKKDN